MVLVTSSIRLHGLDLMCLKFMLVVEVLVVPCGFKSTPMFVMSQYS